MIRISLDFLEKGHLHQLDRYLSPETQSIALEVIFWALSYTLFVQIFSHVLRKVYRRTKIWNYARQREGVFLGNGRDDAVLLTCLGIHHGFAAYLMYKGLTTNHPNTWRHGFLVETGFEVSDYVALILGIYPYAKHDGFKDDIKVALVVHHIPGIVLSVFVMGCGLYKNSHMQKICLCLLGGAFVSCLSTVFTYALNFQTQMTQVAIAFNINAGFFLWCRWYIYPIESIALLKDVHADPALNDGILLYLLYAGGILMAIFNLGICADVLPKCVRYIKRAIDGVTPIETKPVPSSRDSMLYRSGAGGGGNGGRRRSSILVAVDSVSPVSSKARRLSMTTIMGMNAVEDVVQTSKNEDDGDEDLDQDDLAALHRTVSSMGDNDKKDR
eukprot:CAMPEP_0202014786 /NCGR_PEP_ID=MMETSP0905-20130828/30120_1 /ASSEMBLY_ACC=CAM_ASM_000554 /TAXON_ID=420261 /ORGANISM="Thalassiosira antarctica, Strain CCMP982" /LENGTH=384 /DNA_ID=CAMNT_0048574785 /DNA_START=80 /DNA_END=1234 /DNA_ORIENTATION=+